MSSEVVERTSARKPSGVEPTVVDGVDVVGSLSPSRAGDFMTCPLLYRFRTVDPMPVQVDGEVSEFERGVAVTVEIVPGALHTVL